MNFYKNSKKLYYLRIILLIGFLLLLGVNIYNVLFEKDTRSYWGIVGNLFMAVSMALQIRQYNKEKSSDDL